MVEGKNEVGAYEVLTDFCVGNGKTAGQGDVIELNAADARRWTGLGYVEKTDKKVGPAKPDPNHRKAIRNRDPKTLQNQDPK